MDDLRIRCLIAIKSHAHSHIYITVDKEVLDYCETFGFEGDKIKLAKKFFIMQYFCTTIPFCNKQTLKMNGTS